MIAARNQKRHAVSWTGGLLWALAATALCAFIAFVVIPLFFPWSAWNCERQEVDINTGRMKYTRHLFFTQVSERIEDSAFTKALPKDAVESATPEWHRVNTFSPGLRHSPHHAFHGAFSQIKMLRLWWEMENVPVSIQKITVAHILALWKYDQSDSLAKYYLLGLEMGDPANREKLFMTMASLKIPLLETNATGVVRTILYPDGRPLKREQGYHAPDGTFVNHGICEMWYPNGKISMFGHSVENKAQGRSFSWDRDGTLSSISTYSSNELVEYESQNLEAHPDYSLAVQIRATNGVPTKQHEQR